MKIIFLDVDGVLNCHTTSDKCGPYKGIEDKKVSLLKKIVDETNASIVLISTWKEYWYKESCLKDLQDDLANYLDMKLNKQGLIISDKTDDFNLVERGDGILEYIGELTLNGISIENYIIIDDEIFDYQKLKLVNHLIKTDYHKDGLSENDAQKAIKMLNEKVFLEHQDAGPNDIFKGFITDE